MKPVAVLLSLLLATTAYAGDEVTPIDVCKDLSFIARDAMTARQKNRPMSETLPITMVQIKDWGDKYGLEMDSESVEEMSAELVMHAYRSSSYGLDGNGQYEISKLENDYFEECYKDMTSDSEE